VFIVWPAIRHNLTDFTTASTIIEQTEGVSLLFYVLGRGVFSTANIDNGAFLCQYDGELITGSEGERREVLIPSCFRFFLQTWSMQLVVSISNYQL